MSFSTNQTTENLREKYPNGLEQFCQYVLDTMGGEYLKKFIDTVNRRESLPVPKSIAEAKSWMIFILDLANLSQSQITVLEQLINNTVGQKIDVDSKPDLSQFNVQELLEMRKNAFDALLFVYSFKSEEFDAQTPYQELVAEIARRSRVD